MSSGLLYLDTSAWLKLYVQEDGAELVHQVVSEANQVCIHLLAYAELRAAIARAEREDRINVSQKKQIIDALEKDWTTFNIIQPVEMIIRHAGLYCDQFALRGYDSIHLASAEAISIQIMPEITMFASFDRKLNKAAYALGMSILPLNFRYL